MPRSTKRILAADDNPQDILLLEEAFRLGNIAVSIDSVCDGDELLQKLEATVDPFDLLLIDCHLPRRSAEEVLQHLRKRGRTIAAPIAVLTSFVGEVQRRELVALGAQVVLSKPLELQEYVPLAIELDNLMKRDSVTQKRDASTA